MRVCFVFGSCATCVFRAPMFIVQCLTIPHDHRCWFFCCSTYRSTFSLTVKRFYPCGAFERNTQVRWRRPRSWRRSHGRPCCVEGLQLFHSMRCRDVLCLVLASIVRVVCFCSLCLSACRAWPTLNMKHKFAHILLRRT